MKNLFSKISLKRIFSLFTISTTCLLFLVILFAGKQYLLYKHCETLVDSSQELLFQFTGIKEHINTSFLNKKNINNSELIIEIQGMNSRLQTILDDVLIPEEFKLALINQLDLVNITVSLRNIKNSQDSPSGKEFTALSTQLRNVHAKLSSFNQLISRYTQKQLLGLHQALVGLLCIVIALVSIMLLVINKYITSPIIHYCRTLFPDESDNISLLSLHKTIESLAVVETKTSTVTSHADATELSRLYRYSSIGHLLGGLSHELTNISNGAINYTQALLDISNDLQLDEDSRQLLQKLFTEEKKMTRLLSNMTTFTSGSLTAGSKALSLDEIFEQVSSLVRGTFKKEGIEMTISLHDPAVMLNNHVSDLQLVVLSALQNCRIALNSLSAQETLEQKQISITIDDKDLTEKEVSIQIYDNGTVHGKNFTTDHGEHLDEWHNMSFCTAFLGTFNGSLDVARNQDNTNSCTIMVPLHGTTDT